MDFPTHPFYSPFHHQPPPTTSNTRLKTFLAPPTYVPTHMQHHSLMHVCYDHSNKNHCITLLTYSFTIINIIHFINSSIHYILIQFIIHIAFNISIYKSDIKTLFYFLNSFYASLLTFICCDLVFDYEILWCKKSHEVQMNYLRVHGW